MPNDRPAVVRIAEVRAHLDRIRALGDARRMEEARKEAELARREADATGFPPVEAEAAFLLGRLIHGFGEPGAVAPLEDAVRLAELARDDRLAADSIIELVGAMADLRLAQAAIPLSRVAEALVLRAGNRPEQRGALLSARGTALGDAGKLAEAVAALTEARALVTKALGPKHPITLDAEFRALRTLEGSPVTVARRLALARELIDKTAEVFGPDHPQLGLVLSRAGLYQGTSGRFAASQPLIERSIAIAETTFGRSSLRAAVALNVRAVIEESQGHLDEAERDYQRVLAIRRQHLEPDNPLVAHALANLSIITRLRGRLEEARDQVQTAIAIMRHAFGDAHWDVAYESMVLAAVLEDQGDLDGARANLRRSLDIHRQLAGPEHLVTLMYAVELGDFEARHGNCAAARKLVAPAAAVIEKDAGADHPTLGLALRVLGRCDVEDGAPAAARARLERALAIVEQPGAAPVSRAGVRFELARALAALGASTRAYALAVQADKELAQSGPQGARDLRRVKAWLKRAKSSSARPISTSNGGCPRTTV
jgi:tetratricopeptide (TPR) repeat protein